ncbi:hypothetical protein [Bradyrhizobium sp. CCBAU 11357]|uniref:hypothetical protein n=1 Tax=Bradyrhizobium sp. CCBAU 11357 TaxID=1630808 RepID=UPI0023033A51|nr:hypothetical protein [Bradyrhizobium sp. CCBAU 11357]
MLILLIAAVVPIRRIRGRLRISHWSARAAVLGSALFMRTRKIMTSVLVGIQRQVADLI